MGNSDDLDPEEWVGFAFRNVWGPPMTNLPQAPEDLLKVLRCNCVKQTVTHVGALAGSMDWNAQVHVENARVLLAQTRPSFLQEIDSKNEVESKNQLHSFMWCICVNVEENSCEELSVVQIRR